MPQFLKAAIYITLLILNVFSLIVLISPKPTIRNSKKKNKLLLKIGGFKEKNIIFKTIACYVIPFLSLYFLFAIINFKNGFSLDLLLKTIKNTLKSIGFEIEFSTEYSLNSIFKISSSFDILHMITFVLIYLYSLCVFYYSIITGIFKSLKNYFLTRLALKKNCDILLGIDNIEIYAKEDRNIVVWLLPNISKEAIDYLRELNIPYIKKDFSYNELLNLNLKYYKNEYNIISFNNDEDNLLYISEFIKFIEYKDKKGNEIYNYHNLFIHTEITIDNLNSIHDKILSNNNKFSAYINIFNRYELTALKFISDYPITKFLPNDFIVNAAVENNKQKEEIITLNNCDKEVSNCYDKMINVLYLGFGKVSKELFKSQVINDQLVSYNPLKKEIKAHIINYFAFDNKSHNVHDKNELFYSKRYNVFKEKIEQNIINKNDYFEMPEELYNFYNIRGDVNDKSNIDNILKLLSIEGSFNQLIISLENDLDNIDYALKLIMVLNENNITNYHLFVRIKNENAKTIELLGNKDKISFFGCDSFVLNSDVIINERLLSFAKLMNSKYNQKRLSNTSWYSLSPIKQKSNIYAGLSIRSKLNLINADYTDDLNCIENKECLNKLQYDFNTYSMYMYDDNINIAKIISYQEKLRWNAFYIMNGYIPYEKKNIRYKKIDNMIIPTELSFIKDDENRRTHACITSSKGLDEYHNVFKNIVMYEKFDYTIDENEKLMHLSSFKKFIEFNCLNKINLNEEDSLKEFVKLNNEILKNSLYGIDKSFNSIHSKFIYYLVTNKLVDLNEEMLSEALLDYFQVYKYDYSLLENLNTIFENNVKLKIISKE